MGTDPQSLTGRPRRAGIALPMALLALVAMAAIPATLLTIAWAQGQTERGRSDAALAVELAEAGTAQAVGLIGTKLSTYSFTRLLLGWDNLPNTADDGLITGYNLPTNEQIPTTGMTFISSSNNLGSYTVRILNDPAEATTAPLTDGNNRIVIQCISQTRGGSSATVNLVWTRLDPLRVAIATAGNLDVFDLRVNGGCKDVYVGDTLRFANNTGFTGSEGGGGGTAWRLPPNSKRDPVPAGTTVDLARALYFPNDQNPTSQCPLNAIVTNGSIGGWGGSGNNQTITRVPVTSLAAGVHCVKGGSVYLSASGQLRADIAIIADGHISIEHTASSSNARLTFGRKMNDGTALVAGGDIAIRGRVSVDGNIYCRSQFSMQGLSLGGQLICADERDPQATIVGGGTVECRDAKGLVISGSACPRSIAGLDGHGGAFAGWSTFVNASGTTDGNSVTFSCQAKYVKPGFELSRVAWYQTFGS